ncbi:competence/damage-inducible protein A [Thermobrachium celere]|uniref:competence/damage-inducible protein A n=1 Tax=Thermobrachium celere TaxID=53422 RepID=UPI0019453600|nr:competence/damage-inducible protein A [Thermobrachium celere]GFR35371.1 putative competence-damage inducible protein [Thermobrachium celere]
MKAELICVGTELLLGDIVNTNAAFIAKNLAMLGIDHIYEVVVGDNKDRLKAQLEITKNRSDIIILSGGLGPTQDDLTKETVAEHLNKKLVFDENVYKHIEEYFNKIKRPITENSKKQAYVIEGSRVLMNEWGTAPGLICEENNKTYILLPGPPMELEPMFNKYVFPYLKERSSTVLVSKTVKIMGIGEAMAEEMVKDLIKSQNPTLAPYAKDGEVHFRITAKAKNEEEAQSLIQPVYNRLKEIFGINIYAEDDQTLEEVVANLLIKNNLTIAVAESCTGGLVTSKLVNYPGISSVLLEGVVTYSNDSKIKRLMVSKETLKLHGAVSYQTAIEMAEGVAKTAKADIGISTTGIAGPSGGTSKKPVGLVYLGVYIKGYKTFKELKLTGDRQRIRERASKELLDFLRRELKTEMIGK